MSLKTKVYKINNDYLDFSDVFSVLESNGYEHIVKKYSGDYFSATFLKSYLENPAGSILNQFVPPNIYLQIGTDTHSILEKFYTKGDRTTVRLTSLAEGYNNSVKDYINNYIYTEDYLNNKYEDMVCECEVEGKEEIYIPNINKTIPTCKYFIDRVDYRDDKVYIIDYKTGKISKKSFTFDGYLGQMIIYKWAIEQKLQKPVEEVYICALKDKQYYPVSITLEDEKYMYDQVCRFFDNINESKVHRIYQWTDKGFFMDDFMKDCRYKINSDNINLFEINVTLHSAKDGVSF